jgi:hypothetical protein
MGCLSVILWIVSLIMIIVDFHWGWLVAFIITTLYLIIKSGGGGGKFDFDFDFDFSD